MREAALAIPDPAPRCGVPRLGAIGQALLVGHRADAIPEPGEAAQVPVVLQENGLARVSAEVLAGFDASAGARASMSNGLPSFRHLPSTWRMRVGSACT